MKKLFILLFTIAIFGTVEVAFASELNFSVETIPSEYQVDEKKTYLDLRLAPKQTREERFILANGTPNTVDLEITINHAVTNLNGVANYSAGETKNTDGLVYMIEDLVTYEKKVSIPANSSITYPVIIKMPDADFSGVLAGGVTFKEVNNKQPNQAEESKGMAIENEFSFVKGLVLHGKEEKILPELDLIKAYPSQVNGRNAFTTVIQNKQPIYVNDVVIKTEIAKKGTKEVLYKNQKENMQMVPNSHLDFPTLLDGKKLEAGDYTAKVTVYAVKDLEGAHDYKNLAKEEESYTYKWDFNKEFTVKAEEAKNFNKKDVTIPKDNSMLMYSLLGLACLIIIVLLVIILRRRSNDNEAK
ncbi:hypothetical protein IGI37_003807 [Enterococcus sp. AZ194]|uniref:DUF916 and DUF3324 domain-containing protein n=1 Tax=Enterococcus sp. AZ194 TaxID=2774629 RepID=UPI003F1F20BA